MVEFHRKGLLYPGSGTGASQQPWLLLPPKPQAFCTWEGWWHAGQKVQPQAHGLLQTPANNKQPSSSLLTGLFLEELNAGLALGKIIKVGKSAASSTFSSSSLAACCPSCHPGFWALTAGCSFRPFPSSLSSSNFPFAPLAPGHPGLLCQHSGDC